MKRLYTFILSMFFISCGSGGQTNHCNTSSATYYNFTTESEDCSFQINQTFTACVDADLSEATIADMATNGDNINCEISVFGCDFNIVNTNENTNFSCRAYFDGEYNPTGQIFCYNDDESCDIYYNF
jgi:hypothetical protein